MLMSLAKKFSAGLIAAIGAGAFAIATPATAGVIVKSSGPSSADFPVGKKLKDTDRITLKAGDIVTVLGSSGTRVLKGAGTYRAGGRGKKTRARFSDLTRSVSANRFRTGTARTGSQDVRSPNIWYVDVTKSGKMCVADLANVTLWRPPADDDQTYILGPKANDFHYHVSFNDDALTRRIDNERLELQEGSEYTISGPKGGAETSLTFAVLEEVPENAEAMATTLIEQGCNIQLDLLAQAMESDAQ